MTATRGARSLGARVAGFLKARTTTGQDSDGLPGASSCTEQPGGFAKTRSLSDVSEATASTAASVDSVCASRQLRAARLAPHHFEVCRRIGRGSYASVYLSRHAGTHTLCALKAISKRKAAKNLKHLRSEKEIAQLMHSPFVVGMAGTFQDELHLYFVLDYEPGGDLYTRLRRSAGGRLPLEHATFYAACTALAIEHVHGQGCVHRDIKPENLLLDAWGYPRLTDFGFARKLEEGQKLVSMFGTPEYVAPEILNEQGHGQAADLWSLGVLVYELLVGSSPWCHSAQAPSTGKHPTTVDDIYQSIVSGHVDLRPLPDRHARDLIKGLLRQDPQRRLGVGARLGAAGTSGSSGAGLQALMAHSFFRRIDWARLRARRVPAPRSPAPASGAGVVDCFAPLAPGPAVASAGGRGQPKGGDTVWGGAFEGF